MGTSSDADLDFGIDFEESVSSFPWMARDDEGDSLFDSIEQWWLKETGCAVEYPTKGYHDVQIQHLKDHPMPFDLHTHCHYDYPMYILKIPGYGWRANRGYPTVVDPSKMVVNPDDIERFKLACEKYNIPYSEPKWIMSSVLG
jgi:hypothetical protein